MLNLIYPDQGWIFIHRLANTEWNAERNFVSLEEDIKEKKKKNRKRTNHRTDSNTNAVNLNRHQPTLFGNFLFSQKKKSSPHRVESRRNRNNRVARILSYPIIATVVAVLSLLSWISNFSPPPSLLSNHEHFLQFQNRCNSRVAVSRRRKKSGVGRRRRNEGEREV